MDAFLHTFGTHTIGSSRFISNTKITIAYRNIEREALNPQLSSNSVYRVSFLFFITRKLIIFSEHCFSKEIHTNL
jgi:hypothetical protein